MDNKSLDLSNNEELLFVDVLNNNLEYLDVSNCPELQCLNVSNNKLVSIDLSNNKN